MMVGLLILAALTATLAAGPGVAASLATGDRAAAGAALHRIGATTISRRRTIIWMAAVATIYAGATYVRVGPLSPDRMMLTAAHLLQGADLGPEFFLRNDVVTVGGRNYAAMSIGPMLVYLPFVPFPFLWGASRWLVSTVVGIVAAWLCLPLARRYGPPGATYWLATLGAFGTLLFPLAIEGDFYYLAHLEAMACTFVALIEWQDRRRPWVVALALGLAALARPTVLLAAVPFGVALVASSRQRTRTVGEYLVPLAAAVAIMGAYDFLRFGSVTETGYEASVLWTPGLAALRAQGLFSPSHLGPNLALLLGGGFGVRATFPWLVASKQGQSILLTTPALLMAAWAGLRDRTNQVLWAAAVLTAVPVLLYYGGGGADTYGYRYALDFTPFLLALVAVAAGSRFGGLERALIVASVAFCSYGFVWAVFN